jgi:hypothetical protein
VGAARNAQRATSGRARESASLDARRSTLDAWRPCGRGREGARRRAARSCYELSSYELRVHSYIIVLRLRKAKGGGGRVGVSEWCGEKLQPRAV